MENTSEFLQYYPGKNQQELIKDGIINPEIYFKENLKLLFICKEHNQRLEKLENGDYTIWWNEGLKYGFSSRIAEWAYGIMNNFPEFLSINSDMRTATLKKIAFMNVKKIAANSRPDDKELNEIILLSREQLLNQIRVINPDLIICSLGSWTLVESLFGVQWKDFKTEDNKNGSFEWEKKKVIKFRHPSNRKKLTDSYDLLQHIVRQSKVLS